MDIVNIEALVAQGKIVKTANIDPNNDYVVIGKWQPNNRKKGGDGNAYPSYAVPLSELLGGGSTYTASNGVVLVGNDIQLASHNISQFTNDAGYLTLATASGKFWQADGNTFGAEKSIGTLDNYALPFIVNANEVARFTTDGAGLTRLYINANTNLHGSNAGIQYSSTFTNRAQLRVNAYGNHNGVAGITGFKSRGATVGATQSVLAGDTLFRITAIGISGDNSSLNLAALIDVKVTAGGVFPAYVATDFTVDLMDVTGVRSEKFRVNHDGTYTVNNIYTFPNVDGLANQVLKTDGLGNLTWQSDAAGPIATTAGNTLLTCITDIFVKNISSCSPLNINATNGQDVYIVAGGGNVGIGTILPTSKFHVKGDAIATNFSAIIENSTDILYSVRNDGIHTLRGPGNPIVKILSGGIGIEPELRFEYETLGGGTQGTITGSNGLKLKGTGLTTLQVGANGVGIGNSLLPLAKFHVQDTIDGISTGNPNILNETTNGGLLIKYKSVNGSQILFDEGGVTQGSFTNASGYSQIAFNQRFSFKNASNITKFWIDNANGYVGIGPNYFAATAQLHVQSALAGNAVKIEDAVGNNLVSISNDSVFEFGWNNAPLQSRFTFNLSGQTGSDFTIKNISSASAFQVKNVASNTLYAIKETAFNGARLEGYQYIDTFIAGGATSIYTRLIDGAFGLGSGFTVNANQARGVLTVQGLTSAYGSHGLWVQNSAGVPSLVTTDDGDVGVGAVSNGTRLFVKGRDDGYNYNFWFENQSGIVQFYMFNNSEMIFNPTQLANRTVKHTSGRWDMAFGNLNLGLVTTPMINTGDRLNILGNSIKGNFYQIRSMDANQTMCFSVKDNGEVAMPSLPTSTVGLAAGSLWVDTADSNRIKMV